MSAVLLPPNRSPLESAVDAVDAARYPLPTRAVAATWSPDACPPELLGTLAWELGIELWDDAWPETKKREVCRNAFALHRLKTTPAGIRAHVALAGSEVTRIIRPPARGFLRAAMTDAQRQAWLDDLPQVRVYPFAHAGIVRCRSFHRSPARRIVRATLDSSDWTASSLAPTADVAGAFGTAWAPRPPAPRPLGRGVLRSSRGPQLIGTRATLYDRGTERDIAHASFDGGGYRFLVGNTGSRRSWHGHGAHGQGWRTRTTAPERVFTLRFGDDAAGFAVASGLEPVDVRPARTFEQRVAPPARSFFGRSGKRFLRTSYAPFLVYDRVSIRAPERIGERRRTHSFHGAGRFGLPPFTAELRIAVPMTRPQRRSGRWHGVGFRKAPAFDALNRAIEAVRVSKAHRDTILIDTTTHRAARFGEGLTFGSFTFGQLRKVA